MQVHTTEESDGIMFASQGRAKPSKGTGRGYQGKVVQAGKKWEGTYIVGGKQDLAHRVR